MFGFFSGKNSRSSSHGCFVLQQAGKRSDKNIVRTVAKIAKILNVPLEKIYEADENMTFVFNDNSTGNGNIVTNYSLPQDVLNLYKKHISVLEQEIHYLKELLKKASE